MAPERGQHRAAPPSAVRRGARRRLARAALRPVGRAEAEARHLHAVEQAGESGETPFIALLGLLLFFLPVFGVLMGLAFAAYYLA